MDAPSSASFRPAALMMLLAAAVALWSRQAPPGVELEQDDENP